MNFLVLNVMIDQIYSMIKHSKLWQFEKKYFTTDFTTLLQ